MRCHGTKAWNHWKRGADTVDGFGAIGVDAVADFSATDVATTSPATAPVSVCVSAGVDERLLVKWKHSIFRRMANRWGSQDEDLEVSFGK